MSAAVHLVMPFAHSLRQLEDWGKPEILETNAVMKMAWLLYLEIPFSFFGVSTGMLRLPTRVQRFPVTLL